MQWKPSGSRRRSCDGKKQYDSWNDANNGLRQSFLRGQKMTSKSVGTGMKLEIYRCRYCPGWHVGHNVK